MKFDTFTIHSNVDGDAGNVQLLSQLKSVLQLWGYGVEVCVQCAASSLLWCPGDLLERNCALVGLYAPRANDALEHASTVDIGTNNCFGYVFWKLWATNNQ